jgi:hypothetical protein
MNDDSFSHSSDPYGSWQGWSDPYGRQQQQQPRPQHRRPPAAVLGPPYGAWYNIPEIEILGMKFGTADALARATDAQIELAEKGRGLAKYNAVAHESRFYQAPTNNIGAYYRSAYWLAVGSRVLISRGERKAAAKLLKKAKKDRSYLDLKLLTSVPFSPDVGKEVPIMKSAGKLAEDAGLVSIAKVLGVLPTRIEFAREVREQRGLEKGLPDMLLKTAQLKSITTGERPWWLWPLVGGIGLIAAAVIFRPYFTAAKKVTKKAE